MKCAMVAMMIWLGASVVCVGQKPEPLRFRLLPQKPDQMEVTAILSGTGWKDGEAEAIVVANAGAGIGSGTIKGNIGGGGKEFTVQTTYTKPTAEANKAEFTLTVLKDKKKGEGATFTGRIPLVVRLEISLETGVLEAKARLSGTEGDDQKRGEATVESADSALKILLSRPITYAVDEDNTLTLAVPYTSPAKEIRGSQLVLKIVKSDGQAIFLEGAVPDIPAKQADPEPFAWRDWLVYADSVLLGLLVVGLCTRPLWRRRFSHRNIPQNSSADQPLVQAGGLDLGPDVRSARSEAGKALVEAETAKRNAALAREEGKQTNQRLESALNDLAALQNLQLPSLVHERNSNLSHLGRVLENFSQDAPVARAKSDIAEPRREEAAAAAIVNRWLDDGRRNRAELITLAARLDIEPRLANHRELSRVFEDLTTFEYPFVFEEDGPWLWVPIAGTEDFWAAPADAAFFGMGDAPKLLDRLFEGMQGAGQGFRFSTIYRPCRLRPVPGGGGLYTVARKGLLRLAGGKEPAEARPEDFNSLVPEKVLPPERGPSGGSPGRRLADWIQLVSGQLEEQRKQQRSTQQILATMPKATSLPSGDATLRREFKQQTEVWERRFARLEAELRERPAVLAQAPAPTSTLQTLEEPLGVRSAVEVEAPVAAVAEDAVMMPEGWRDALQWAAKKAGSEPGEELPREEVYVQRARNLVSALLELEPGCAAALVHLKVGGQNDTFEVHETEDGSDLNGAMCVSCRTAHTWQLAVCVGARPGGRLFILYPLGSLSKSRYQAGYAGLIAEMPSPTFTITGSAEPAWLRRVGEGAAVYSVERKMHLALGDGMAA